MEKGFAPLADDKPCQSGASRDYYRGDGPSTSCRQLHCGTRCAEALTQRASFGAWQVASQRWPCESMLQDVVPVAAPPLVLVLVVVLLLMVLLLLKL